MISKEEMMNIKQESAYATIIKEEKVRLEKIRKRLEKSKYKGLDYTEDYEICLVYEDENNQLQFRKIGLTLPGIILSVILAINNTIGHLPLDYDVLGTCHVIANSFENEMKVAELYMKLINYVIDGYLVALKIIDSESREILETQTFMDFVSYELPVLITTVISGQKFILLEEFYFIIDEQFSDDDKVFLENQEFLLKSHENIGNDVFIFTTNKNILDRF